MTKSHSEMESEILVLKNKISRIKKWLLEAHGLEIPDEIINDKIYHRALIMVKAEDQVHVIFEPSDNDPFYVHHQEEMQFHTDFHPVITGDIHDPGEESDATAYEGDPNPLPMSLSDRDRLICRAFDLDPAIVGPLSVHLNEPPKLNQFKSQNYNDRRKAKRRALAKPKMSTKYPELNLTVFQVSYLTKLRNQLKENPKALVRACIFCPTKVPHPRLLPYHIQETHMQGDKYYCSDCNKEFRFQQALTRHLQLTHKKTIQIRKRHRPIPKPSKKLHQNTRSKSKGIKELEKPKEKRLPIFRCTIPGCDVTFGRKGEWVIHVKSHNAHRCPHCPRKNFLGPKNLAKHLLRHEQGLVGYATKHLVICEQCGRSMKKGSLFTHILRYHKKVKPFPCNDCEKRFVTSETLKKHQRSHLDPKIKAMLAESEKSPCQFCGKMMANERNMKRHIRHQHEGVKNYVCEVKGCERAFGSSCERMDHYGIHLNPDRKEYDPDFDEICPEKVRQYLERRKELRKKYAVRK